MRRTQEPGGLILIVEDNRNISEMVGEYLEGRGFEVDYAADGLDGYRLASENSYDVIVLDLMLPRLDGIEVCRRLREEARKSTPVLMLTARDTLDEKLTGLGAGADDYLVKPFHVEEVVARLRAIIRRAGGLSSSRIEIGDLVLDTRLMQVSREGVPVSLPPQEYRLLAYLAHQRGRVVSRMEIIDHLYHQDFERESNSVEVLVGRIRRRVGEDVIKTRRGFGYYLQGDDA